MLTEEIRVQVSGLQLAAKQFGDPEQPAILALHGWLDNAASFDRLAPCIHNYRFIAMDLVGNGFSEHRADGARYHMLDNVDDVIGMADALGLEKFVLLGHSMGAGIATYTAASFPERVSELVLIEGIGTHTSKPEDGPKVLRTAVNDLKMAGAKRKPIYETRDEAIYARAQGIGGISIDASTTLCTRGLETLENGFTWRSDPRLKMSSAIRLTEEMVHAHLAALTMPVLLVSGKQSFFAATETLRNRAGCIKDCHLVELEGNHHLHLEPATFPAVADAINDFLSQRQIR